MKKFLRRPSGFLGVCCLWAAILVLFGFVATYRDSPTDSLNNSEDPVERRRSIESSKEVLGDEKVAGLVESLQGRLVVNNRTHSSRVRMVEETARLRQWRAFSSMVNSQNSSLLPGMMTEVKQVAAGGRLPSQVLYISK